MSNRLLLLGITVGACWPLSVSTAFGAPSYTCAASTSAASAGLKNYVVRLVTATTDTALVATRTAFGLPAGAASTVSVVTALQTCKKAGAAYQSALNKPTAPAPDRAMVVVKVGSTRFVLLDPLEKQGEFEVNIVTTAQWVALAMFTG